MKASMKKTPLAARWMAAIAAAGCASTAAHATEMVYYPVNPSFGGSPLNGPWMLNSAQAQNKHTDPDAGGGFELEEKTPLQQFNESLERAVLNRLASTASAQLAGADGQLQPGTVETGNFIIDIVDLGGGVLQITTTDKVLGTSTSFQVGQ